MENLILGFDGVVPSLDQVAALMKGWTAVEVQPDQLVVCEEENCAFVRRQERPERWWFDHWPPLLVPDNPKALVVAYRDTELAKRIVCALARRYRFVVDTDSEGVYAVEDFAKRCTREPEWDWLREAWLALPRRKGGPVVS
jgi:hypothetical protein